MRCSIYGLTLDLDPPVPGLRSAPDDSAVDVVIRLAARRGNPAGPPADAERWYESDWLDDTGTPGLMIFRTRRTGAFMVRHTDGFEFAIDAEGRTVVGHYPDGSTLIDIANRITGPVLGFLLRLRGIVALHASVVEMDGGGVAFVGDAGAGKSTTAAMFARDGYRVVTEDVAALTEVDGTLAVCAGSMDVALRPDAVARLFGSVDALPKFSPSWDKRRLELTTLDASAPLPVPLRAVYLLTNTATVADAPCMRPIAAADALLELLANIYGNRLLHEELRTRELDVLQRLVETVPVRVAATGARPELIPRFCEVVRHDVLRS